MRAPLRVTSSQREIEDMIWEVDENLDGAVDWGEFLLMFRRNVTDKTGLEPFQLFAVVQFCMYDKEFVGKISVDETMQMLYARCGRDRLEAEMKVGAHTWRATTRCCHMDCHVVNDVIKYVHILYGLRAGLVRRLAEFGRHEQPFLQLVPREREAEGCHSGAGTFYDDKQGVEVLVVPSALLTFVTENIHY